MNNKGKIYTRKGDRGETSLLGGTRVPKYHLRIEAYGTVDELNSVIGMLLDQPMDDNTRRILLVVQNKLFVSESLLAAERKEDREYLPRINNEDIDLLEEQIDLMNRTLPELSSFILPGGHPANSLSHFARTVCRRAERIVIQLSEQYEVDELVVKYLNRLSDYLFVLARKFTYDNKSEEIIWKPGK